MTVLAKLNLLPKYLETIEDVVASNDPTGDGGSEDEIPWYEAGGTGSSTDSDARAGVDNGEQLRWFCPNRIKPNGMSRGKWLCSWVLSLRI